MKKLLPYILLVILILVTGTLFFNRKASKFFDARVTLQYNSTKPYGSSVFYSCLPLLLNNATVKLNKDEPSNWYYGNDSLLNNNVLIILTKKFNPSETELLILEKFAKAGNDIFISCLEMNTESRNYFGIQLMNNSTYNYFETEDSLVITLQQPAFTKDTNYTYPGYFTYSYFHHVNEKKLLNLGTTAFNKPNFLKASIGSGNIYLHSNPFAFTNYFLLNKNNKNYIEKAFALFPSNTKKIIWDEYFLLKRETFSQNQQDEQPNSLRVLMSYPSFKWAFWLMMALIALYLLLETKRSQRYIPILSKPKNESLDFIQTIGKLYFEKQDHINLAQKMATYFLEHVRSKYFINTSVLNNEFVQKLSGKSGYSADAIKEIIRSIYEIQNSNTNISQTQLANYYKQFKNFYKNTV